MRVAAADLDGDGHLDLAALDQGYSEVAVLLGDGTGSFGAPAAFDTGRWPAAFAVADVNGGGKPDLVVLILDRSASMGDRGELAIAKRELAKNIQEFSERVEFGIVMFDVGVATYPSSGMPAQANPGMKASDLGSRSLGSSPFALRSASRNSNRHVAPVSCEASCHANAGLASLRANAIRWSTQEWTLDCVERYLVDCS